jgi:beta-galactosidase
MTRGYYVMPSDSLIICPDRWDIPYYNPSFSCSAYDNCRTPWGNSHEASMLNVKKSPFISGQFVWTGFDYIGEPTPYGWPARSSYFGIVGLAGFPKDVYYMYQSEWRQDLNVLHLFPHWNWQPGQTVDLWAYYNNADEVELFVNGVSQGVKSKDDDHLHVWWRVTYQPGEVKAVSRKDGKVVAEQTIKTAGEPAAIRLTADRSEIKADGYDLSYITVEVVDKAGNLCPWADNNVKFEVSGAGVNVGVDNGSPISMERFKADNRNAFYGKALLIVQSDGTEGEIRVNATSNGLNADTLTIKTY